MIKVSKLKPNPQNPRVIRDAKFTKLKQSIQDFPEMMTLRPMVVSNGHVIGGNMRLKAIIDLGIKEVPDEWVKYEDLSEEKEMEFIIKDNVGFGEWEWDTLANEWDEVDLAEWGLEFPGSDDPEPTPGQTDPDDIPENVEAITKPGDLWILGEHRLLCGDSTNADDVQKLLKGGSPELMVTDPPYGVEYDPAWRARLGTNSNPNKQGKVENDDRADWTDAWALFTGSVVYCWHADRYSSTVEKSLKDCDFEIRAQVIWAKDRMAMSRGDYHWKHEPCWYAVKKGAKGSRTEDRTQTTLWEIKAREDSGHGHGTQKPVECMLRPIQNHTHQEVYDPFLGSGTTLIAAEQLGRKCYGMEISPQYCDVIVKRWEDFTGKKAELEVPDGVRVKEKG